MRTAATADAAAAVLDFLRGNDHFFLNLSMAACKATLDAAHGIDGSTVVTAMAATGSTSASACRGTGDAWFTAPVGVPDGLYFPGYGPDDANPDLGDSAITETCGIGGFAMAAAPAIVRFVGGTAGRRARATPAQMYRITLARNPAFALPPLGFAGTPTGIDARRVVETRRRRRSSTPGIAHREAGVGQIGAGIARAPLACFGGALRGLGRRLGVPADRRRLGGMMERTRGDRHRRQRPDPRRPARLDRRAVRERHARPPATSPPWSPTAGGVVVTHGNGPQVGFILLRSELVGDDVPVPRLTLDMCVADSQGGIGHILGQRAAERARPRAACRIASPAS